MIAWKLDEITAPDGKKINLTLDRREKREKKVGKRVKEIVKYTALAPLVLVALPFIVILWIGMRDEGGCHGAVGSEEKLPAGTALSVEVSKDVLLPRIP